MERKGDGWMIREKNDLERKMKGQICKTESEKKEKQSEEKTYKIFKLEKTKNKWAKKKKGKISSVTKWHICDLIKNLKSSACPLISTGPLSKFIDKGFNFSLWFTFNILNHLDCEKNCIYNWKQSSLTVSTYLQEDDLIILFIHQWFFMGVLIC